MLNWILKLEKNWVKLLANEWSLSFCLKELEEVEEFIVWPNCKGPEDKRSWTLKEFLETNIVCEVYKKEY